MSDPANTKKPADDTGRKLEKLQTPGASLVANQTQDLVKLAQTANGWGKFTDRFNHPDAATVTASTGSAEQLLLQRQLGAGRLNGQIDGAVPAKESEAALRSLSTFPGWTSTKPDALTARRPERVQPISDEVAGKTAAVFNNPDSTPQQREDAARALLKQLPQDGNIPGSTLSIEDKGPSDPHNRRVIWQKDAFGAPLTSTTLNSAGTIESHHQLMLSGGGHTDTTFDAQQRPLQQEHYDKGNLIAWRNQYQNGDLVKHDQFKNQKLDLSTEYDEQGNRTVTAFSSDGPTITKKDQYDKSGALTSRIDYENGKPSMKTEVDPKGGWNVTGLDSKENPKWQQHYDQNKTLVSHTEFTDGQPTKRTDFSVDKETGAAVTTVVDHGVRVSQTRANNGTVEQTEFFKDNSAKKKTTTHPDHTVDTVENWESGKVKSQTHMAADKTAVTKNFDETGRQLNTVADQVDMQVIKSTDGDTFSTTITNRDKSKAYLGEDNSGIVRSFGLSKPNGDGIGFNYGPKGEFLGTLKSVGDKKTRIQPPKPEVPQAPILPDYSKMEPADRRKAIVQDLSKPDATPAERAAAAKLLYADLAPTAKAPNTEKQADPVAQGAITYQTNAKGETVILSQKPNSADMFVFNNKGEQLAFSEQRKGPDGITTTAYDEQARQVKSKFPGGSSETKYDETGNKTTTFFGADNQPVAVESELSGTKVRREFAKNGDQQVVTRELHTNADGTSWGVARDPKTGQTTELSAGDSDGSRTVLHFSKDGAQFQGRSETKLVTTDGKQIAETDKFNAKGTRTSALYIDTKTGAAKAETLNAAGTVVFEGNFGPPNPATGDREPLSTRSFDDNGVLTGSRKFQNGQLSEDTDIKADGKTVTTYNANGSTKTTFDKANNQLAVEQKDTFNRLTSLQQFADNKLVADRQFNPDGSSIVVHHNPITGQADGITYRGIADTTADMKRNGQIDPAATIIAGNRIEPVDDILKRNGVDQSLIEAARKAQQDQAAHPPEGAQPASFRDLLAKEAAKRAGTDDPAAAVKAGETAGKAFDKAREEQSLQKVTYAQNQLAQLASPNQSNADGAAFTRLGQAAPDLYARVGERAKGLANGSSLEINDGVKRIQQEMTRLEAPYTNEQLAKSGGALDANALGQALERTAPDKRAELTEPRNQADLTAARSTIDQSAATLTSRKIIGTLDDLAPSVEPAKAITPVPAPRLPITAPSVEPNAGVDLSVPEPKRRVELPAPAACEVPHGNNLSNNDLVAKLNAYQQQHGLPVQKAFGSDEQWNDNFATAVVKEGKGLGLDPAQSEQAARQIIAMETGGKDTPHDPTAIPDCLRGPEHKDERDALHPEHSGARGPMQNMVETSADQILHHGKEYATDLQGEAARAQDPARRSELLAKAKLVESIQRDLASGHGDARIAAHALNLDGDIGPKMQATEFAKVMAGAQDHHGILDKKADQYSAFSAAYDKLTPEAKKASVQGALEHLDKESIDQRTKRWNKLLSGQARDIGPNEQSMLDGGFAELAKKVGVEKALRQTDDATREDRRDRLVGLLDGKQTGSQINSDNRIFLNENLLGFQGALPADAKPAIFKAFDKYLGGITGDKLTPAYAEMNNLVGPGKADSLVRGVDPQIPSAWVPGNQVLQGRSAPNDNLLLRMTAVENGRNFESTARAQQFQLHNSFLKARGQQPLDPKDQPPWVPIPVTAQRDALRTPDAALPAETVRPTELKPVIKPETAVRQEAPARPPALEAPVASPREAVDAPQAVPGAPKFSPEDQKRVDATIAGLRELETKFPVSDQSKLPDDRRAGYEHILDGLREGKEDQSAADKYMAQLVRAHYMSSLMGSQPGAHDTELKGVVGDSLHQYPDMAKWAPVKDALKAAGDIGDPAAAVLPDRALTSDMPERPQPQDTDKVKQWAEAVVFGSYSAGEKFDAMRYASGNGVNELQDQNGDMHHVQVTAVGSQGAEYVHLWSASGQIELRSVYRPNSQGEANAADGGHYEQQVDRHGSPVGFAGTRFSAQHPDSPILQFAQGADAAPNGPRSRYGWDGSTARPDTPRAATLEMPPPDRPGSLLEKPLPQPPQDADQAQSFPDVSMTGYVIGGGGINGGRWDMFGRQAMKPSDFFAGRADAFTVAVDKWAHAKDGQRAWSPEIDSYFADKLAAKYGADWQQKGEHAWMRLSDTGGAFTGTWSGNNAEGPRRIDIGVDTFKEAGDLTGGRVHNTMTLNLVPESDESRVQALASLPTKSGRPADTDHGYRDVWKLEHSRHLSSRDLAYARKAQEYLEANKGDGARAYAGRPAREGRRLELLAPRTPGMSSLEQAPDLGPGNVGAPMTIGQANQWLTGSAKAAESKDVKLQLQRYNKQCGSGAVDQLKTMGYDIEHGDEPSAAKSPDAVRTGLRVASMLAAQPGFTAVPISQIHGGMAGLPNGTPIGRYHVDPSGFTMQIRFNEDPGDYDVKTEGHIPRPDGKYFRDSFAVLPTVMAAQFMPKPLAFDHGPYGPRAEAAPTHSEATELTGVRLSRPARLPESQDAQLADPADLRLKKPVSFHDRTAPSLGVNGFDLSNPHFGMGLPATDLNPALLKHRPDGTPVNPVYIGVFSDGSRPDEKGRRDPNNAHGMAQWLDGGKGFDGPAYAYGLATKILQRPLPLQGMMSENQNPAGRTTWQAQVCEGLCSHNNNLHWGNAIDVPPDAGQDVFRALEAAGFKHTGLSFGDKPHWDYRPSAEQRARVAAFGRELDADVRQGVMFALNQSSPPVTEPRRAAPQAATIPQVNPGEIKLAPERTLQAAPPPPPPAEARLRAAEAVPAQLAQDDRSRIHDVLGTLNNAKEQYPVSDKTRMPSALRDMYEATLKAHEGPNQDKADRMIAAITRANWISALDHSKSGEHNAETRGLLRDSLRRYPELTRIQSVMDAASHMGIDLGGDRKAEPAVVAPPPKAPPLITVPRLGSRPVEPERRQDALPPAKPLLPQRPVPAPPADANTANGSRRDMRADATREAVPNSDTPDWMQQHEKFSKLIKDQKFDLAWYGDSNTHALSTSDAFADLGPKAVALGIDRDSTYNLDYRARHGETDFAGHPPETAVIQIGTNNFDPSRPVADADVVKRVMQTVDLFRERLPDTKLVVVGILPQTDSRAAHERINAINAQLAQQLTQRQNVAFADVGKEFLTPSGDLKKEYFSYVGKDHQVHYSTLHINEAGFKTLVNTVSPLIKPDKSASLDAPAATADRKRQFAQPPQTKLVASLSSAIPYYAPTAVGLNLYKTGAPQSVTVAYSDALTASIGT